jgi:hypothetical protein
MSSLTGPSVASTPILRATLLSCPFSECLLCTTYSSFPCCSCGLIPQLPCQDHYLRPPYPLLSGCSMTTVGTRHTQNLCCWATWPTQSFRGQRRALHNSEKFRSMGTKGDCINKVKFVATIKNLLTSWWNFQVWKITFFELRASHLLGRHSTTWATPLALFYVGYFQDRVSQTIF